MYKRQVPALETEGNLAGEADILPTVVDTSEQNAKDEIKREPGYKSWKKTVASAWNPEPEAEPYKPPKFILATDLHYLSAASHDDGQAFQTFVEHSDGKVTQYLPQLLEAFIDQVIEERPSALILSGDITMNGERVGHEELAEKLSRVKMCIRDRRRAARPCRHRRGLPRRHGCLPGP